MNRIRYNYTIIFINNLSLKFRSIIKDVDLFKSKIIEYCNNNNIPSDLIRFTSIKYIEHHKLFDLDVIEV